MKKRKSIFAALGFLVILFLGSLVFLNKGSALDQCLSLPVGGERDSCYQDLIKNILREKGIGEAFGAVKSLYETDPDFASDCHQFAHLIGEAAHLEFKEKGEFEVVPEAYYCGYGFYHGFIIALASAGEDISLAQQFCAYVEGALGENAQVATLDCYHGIGHGVTDYNSSELVDNSLELCREIAPQKDQFNRCVNGIYHSLGDIYLGRFDEWDEEMKQDPLVLCRRQPVEYQGSCYSAMGYLVMQFFKDDFSAALNYASLISNSEYAKSLIQPMAGYQSYRTISEKKYEENLGACVVLDEVLAKACINGLVEGLSDFGSPGKEHLAVAELCRTGGFSAWVEDFCLDHAVEYFGEYFGQEKKKLLCDLVGERPACKS